MSEDIQEQEAKVSQCAVVSEGVEDDSTKEVEKESCDALEFPKTYTLEQIRGLVFMIKAKSKGTLSLQAISRKCSWSPSRLNSIINHFGKYFPKTRKKQDEIWTKLNDISCSVERINKDSPEKRSENVV